MIFGALLQSEDACFWLGVDKWLLGANVDPDFIQYQHAQVSAGVSDVSINGQIYMVNFVE
jgi:hypothetical protein